MSLQGTGPQTDLNTVAFDTIIQYDWDSDVEFQAGLQSILSATTDSSGKSDLDVSDLALKAKCFYYSRKSGIPISVDLFKTYLTTLPSQTTPTSTPTTAPKRTPSSIPLPPPSSIFSDELATPSISLPPTPLSPPVGSAGSAASSNDTQAPYPTSFAHIVNLITTGQPIPGIKEIPDTLSPEKPSESVKDKRRKPWETTGAGSGETSAV